MKIKIARNRVAELSVEQLYELLGRYFNSKEPVRSVFIEGKCLTPPGLIEVRWSEETEEREI